ncbi:MAG: winged helix-turn-helix domain-containing protein [Terriglobales bacterium]
MVKRNKGRQFYEFGPFRIDPDNRQLLRENEPVSLQPKAFDILLVLVQNAGNVVLKEDLMKTVWPDTFVEEANLSQHIFVLRKTLGDAVEEKRYIVTVPGRGYRFAQKVLAVPEEDKDTEEEPGTTDSTEEQIVVARRSLARVVVEGERKTGARFWLAAAAIAAAIALAAGISWRYQRKLRLTEKDTIVLGDFDNKTGDTVFDGTLRQGLAAQLEQSPFLHLLSDARISQTLSLMTQRKDARLSPELAREVCQRTASTAVLDGTIAQIGTRYLLTLTAINCSTGDMLASAEAKANDKDHVLDALGTVASDIRPKLGESLATVQKFDVTLRQATTSSLEALRADSLGEKFLYQGDPTLAPPYFQRAVELDPNFAMAYLQLGISYYTLGEGGRAPECFAKAFSLREHASEREKLQIDSAYYGNVTGEIYKAIQSLEEVIEIYRHNSAYNGLTHFYTKIGQYEKAADAARKLIASDPDKNLGFASLAEDDIALQNFSGARQVIQQTQARGGDSHFLHGELYTLSFLQSDSAGMQEQERWFASQPRYATDGIALAAETEIYAGHVNKARELTKQVIDSALRAGDKGDAAWDEANRALQEAALGYLAEARESAAEALKLAPGDPGVTVQAALALAMTGETARAAGLAQDLNKKYPLDTQLQLLGLPVIEAQLELDRREPEAAVNALRAGLPIEFADTPFSSNTSCLYPAYLRGEAYLAAGQGTAAAGEFQKIIDHNGLVGNCWTGALAHLGVARANVLQARTSQGSDADAARTRALAAYKDFLTLWKDADADIPILKEAKAEHAKLE